MSDLERGAFLIKDAEFLEAIAGSFEQVKVRPKMAGPKHAEEARINQELFTTKARRLRSIAARIRHVLGEDKP